jgi:hypothetical protein
MNSKTQTHLILLAIILLGMYPFVKTTEEGFAGADINWGDLFSQSWIIILLVVCGSLTIWGLFFLKE